MMSWIFTGMIALSIVFGVINGRMEQVSTAAIGECRKAIDLILQIGGSMCLWAGVMKIAESCHLTHKISRLFSPITCRIFKGLAPKGEAMGAITMNLAANLLGLGNAATPLGISAIQAMEKEERTHRTASNNMVLFVVLNTASLQLIPTTTAMLRLGAGSQAPMEILPAVWIASAVSVASGFCMAKLLEKVWRR